MKSLTIAFACAAVALASTGCRYAKNQQNADGDALAGGEDPVSTLLPADEDGGASGINSGADNMSDDSSLAGALDKNRPFSDYLKPVEGANFAPVYFGFDSTTLPDTETAKIEAVANDLLQNANHVVVIEGNCDERGSNEYNLSLGDKRAIAVRDYLTRLGVAADRIQTTSYGEEKPVDSGHGEASWSKNRRGEFSLYQR